MATTAITETRVDRAAAELASARNALRESDLKFQTLADAFPHMVWSTLPDGFHDYYNLRWYEFTGVPDGSTDGEGWNGMFHPEDQERAWERWRHSLETGDPYEIEYRLRHRSGEYRWVLGRAMPMRDENGRIIRWMGTCTDIHENDGKGFYVFEAVSTNQDGAETVKGTWTNSLVSYFPSATEWALTFMGFGITLALYALGEKLFILSATPPATVTAEHVKLAT